MPGMGMNMQGMQPMQAMPKATGGPSGNHAMQASKLGVGADDSAKQW